MKTKRKIARKPHRSKITQKDVEDQIRRLKKQDNNRQAGNQQCYHKEWRKRPGRKPYYDIHNDRQP